MTHISRAWLGLTINAVDKFARNLSSFGQSRGSHSFHFMHIRVYPCGLIINDLIIGEMFYWFRNLHLPWGLGPAKSTQVLSKPLKHSIHIVRPSRISQSEACSPLLASVKAARALATARACSRFWTTELPGRPVRPYRLYERIPIHSHDSHQAWNERL